MNKILLILIIIFSIGCSSSTNCIKYDDKIKLIAECEVINLIINQKFPSLKSNESIRLIKKEEYNQFTKIGEVEIIIPVDLTSHKKGFISYTINNVTPNLANDLMDKLNYSLKQIINKTIEVAKNNGANGIYLIGYKTKPNDLYSENKNQLLFVFGCNTYLYGKYELLKK